MLSSLQAQNAYTTAVKETASDKTIELKVFASITSRLKSVNPDSFSGYTEMAGVLHENVELWTTLMADVASDENGLPLELRAQIFNLGQFIRKHTFKVLEGSETVDAIIDINTAIITGLKNSLGNQEAA